MMSDFICVKFIDYSECKTDVTKCTIGISFPLSHLNNSSILPFPSTASENKR